VSPHLQPRLVGVVGPLLLLRLRKSSPSQLLHLKDPLAAVVVQRSRLLQK
jgi:hypothetical protein